MQFFNRLNESRRKHSVAPHPNFPLPVFSRITSSNYCNNKSYKRKNTSENDLKRCKNIFWKICVGYYNGRNVVLRKLEDVDFLYENGCFGQGGKCLKNLEFVSETEINTKLQKEKRIKKGKEENKKDEDDEDDESLVLSLCETFFLTYALGCLVVYDLKLKKYLNIKETWQAFSSSYNSPSIYSTKYFSTSNSNNPSNNEFFSPMISSSSSFSPCFAAKYAVYHYFRSKGWVVKSGLKYASDFVLYEKGPVHFHSMYNVIIYTLFNNNNNSNDYYFKNNNNNYNSNNNNINDNNNNNSNNNNTNNYRKNINNNEENLKIYNSDSKDDDDKRKLLKISKTPTAGLSWTELSCLNRITEQVAKKLMIVYVKIPFEVESDYIPLKLISSFSIQEFVVKRWIANKERQPED